MAVFSHPPLSDFLRALLLGRGRAVDAVLVFDDAEAL